MRWLNWLTNLCSRLFRAQREIKAPTDLGAEEIVARILYSRKQFSIAKNRPKPNAFDPWPYSELSGIHVTDLSNSGIWEIAVQTKGDVPGRDNIYARVDVPVEQFIVQSLRAIRDDKGFQRHTSIVGWPQLPDANERKARWKEICLALSQSSEVRVVIPPDPL